MSKLEQLRKAHGDWIAKAVARGDTVLDYIVPCCGGTMRDRAASGDQVWDSLATCVHCGAKYMKVTTATKITATIPEGLQ